MPRATEHSSEQVRFQVSFEYPVHFTTAAFDPENTLLLDVLRRKEPARRHRALVVIDAGVELAAPGFAARVQAYFERHSSNLVLVEPPVVLPGGEPCKNDPNIPRDMLQRIARAGLDRQSFCVIVGGGALLDAVGFAAATAHRGVRVVRLPSTVLAQNDAGIGVKNGVNSFGAKNFTGCFSPPFAVINDAQLLSHLSARDKVAGMAEAVKVALIRDAAFFEWLRSNTSALAAFEPDAMQQMIRRAAVLHLQQISQGGDPFEMGSARPLDFGHWAAHKLEGLSQHELRHGEAVAIGMALDSRYSQQCGLISEAELEAITTLLRGLGFKLFHPALTEVTARGEYAVLAGLREFQEHLGGELSVSLLDGIGKSREVLEMSHPLVLDSITWLEEYFGSRPASSRRGSSRIDSPSADTPTDSRLSE